MRRHRFCLMLISLLLATLACNLSNQTADTDQKLVTNERPVVVLLAPANQNTYLAGSVVTFHAVARDIVSGVARIEVRINLPGDVVTLIQSATKPEGDSTLEATLTWEAVGNQAYLVEVQAYRADGTPSNLEQTSITVVGGLVATDLPTTETQSPTGETPAISPTEEGAPPANLDLPAGGISGTVKVDTPVRQGPGTTFSTVRTLKAGDTVEIGARSVDNLWFAIRVGEGFGWVLQGTIEANGDTSTLITAEP